MYESLDLPRSTLRLLIFFLKKKKCQVILLAVLCVVMGVVPAIDSILLKQIINLIESFSDNEAKNLPAAMIFWIVFYALWWECINIFWRFYDYFYLKTMPYIKGQILDDLYNYTQYHNHKFFQENLAGYITNCIQEGARSFEIILSTFGEKVVRKIAAIIFALIAMYSVHYIFATIFLIWVCVFVGISAMCSNKMNKYSMNYAIRRSIVSGNIVDSIANISAVRMFTSHRFERQNLEVKIDDAIASEQIMQFFMLKLHYVLSLSCSIMILVVVYYLSLLRSEIAISIGDCVLILTLCSAVTNEVWDLTQEVGDIFEEIGAFSQSISLIGPHIVTDIEDARPLSVTEGEIFFKNVTFHYNNNNLFQDQTIRISSKEKVGLVGFSGSGKTTFVNLITRLYDINEGEILIDGQNIKYVTQDSLRMNISIIPQEPILFHRTIFENIRYGKKDASMEEVIEVAKIAHINSFIMDMPEGYNTLCGERGNNLSGGQRQRIIIARAILKNAPILIMDEATSSLDTETEELIQDSLSYLMNNKTVIVIAHRLSTLLNMDRILVFEKGNIVGSGRHEELLNTNKQYKKLWKSQVKGIIL